MKAAEKEVELLERKERERLGLPVEPEREGEELPPIELPKFRVIQAHQRKVTLEMAAHEKKQLLRNVEELESQMNSIKDRLKELNEGGVTIIAKVSPDVQEDPKSKAKEETKRAEPKKEMPKAKEKKRKKQKKDADDDEVDTNNQKEQQDEGQVAKPRPGAIGPDGDFLEFPEYDGSEDPAEWKKAFTHFCLRIRKKVKSEMDPADRKNKAMLHGMLKEKWKELPDDEKGWYHRLMVWDKKRYSHDLAIHKKNKGGGGGGGDDDEDAATSIRKIPKKRKSSLAAVDSVGGDLVIPKKKRDRKG